LYNQKHTLDRILTFVYQKRTQGTNLFYQKQHLLYNQKHTLDRILTFVYQKRTQDTNLFNQKQHLLYNQKRTMDTNICCIIRNVQWILTFAV